MKVIGSNSAFSLLCFGLPRQVLPPQLFIGTPSRVGRIFKVKAVSSTRRRGSRRNYRRKFTSSGSAKLRAAVLSPTRGRKCIVLLCFVLQRVAIPPKAVEGLQGSGG